MRTAHTVLFVCEANVCRSPLMEAVFLADMSMEHWQAASRGTNVGSSTDSMCETAAQIAGVSSTTHTPTAVTASDIHRSDLVITASRAERAAVAVLAPRLRWKIFTLREANILAAERTSRAEWSAAAGGSGRLGDLARFAMVLHGRRGLVAVPESRHRLFGRRAGSHPLDIDDHHGERPSTHKATLNSVHEQASLLRQRLVTEMPVGR